MKRNPKQDGTRLYDCIPQAGKCPHNCNQCFFNRRGAFYTETPLVPAPGEIKEGGIVRMNTGHDSNCNRDLVIETAKQYQHYFFNTSVPKFDFPGPVVFTANAKEEVPPHLPQRFRGVWFAPRNLMFIRLRVSPSNIPFIDSGVGVWTSAGVPVVLTFMAYYDSTPPEPSAGLCLTGTSHEWKVRTLNEYWCPREPFMRAVLARYSDNPLVSLCGGLTASYCKMCLNCETYYIQTMKRMRGE